MGIKQLSKLLQQHAKKAIVTRDINYYSGYTVGIDASLALYQFLIAVRSDGAGLMSGDGETTSHLVGLFYRTARLISSGIKPVFIFDGKPPELKKDFELMKRQTRRDDATQLYLEAEKEGDKEMMEKFDKRQIKVGKKHIDDSKKLLNLLNIPFVEAPSEAEAYAAYLCKQKIIDAVATEDMDALTFGTPILLRNLNAAENKNLGIAEYDLDQILKELKFTMEMFIDLCILLGCDYIPSLKGIGPKTAYDWIKKYKSIEEILKHKKVRIEKNNSNAFLDNWNFLGARALFHDLSNENESGIRKFEKLDFSFLDHEKILNFLVDENNFNKDRVLKVLEKLKNTKSQKQQSKITGFLKKLDPQ